MIDEIRFAFRQLRRSPGFALAVVLTMAIGIGSNTAMYSMFDAIVVRPLDLPEIERVVEITEARNGQPKIPVAIGNVRDWKERTTAFEDVAALSETEASLTGNGDPEHLHIGQVSANLFRLLRAEPWLGRTFLDGEDAPGRDGVVLLNHPFWKTHFGGDEHVMGKALVMDGRTYTIIGVMPKGFRYEAQSDVFIPMALRDTEREDRNLHFYSAIARLKPGVTLTQADLELKAVAAQLEKAHPATNVGWTTQLYTLVDYISGDYTPRYMRMIMWVEFFVLLVICANVSNMYSSRALGRRSEIAIRSAMGAGRARIVRQFLVESLVLSLLGALGGIALARLDIRLNALFMPPHIARYIPGWTKMGINASALGFTLLLAVVAGVITAIAPALAALRAGISDQLKSGSRSVTGDRKSHVMRNSFAVLQITLSVTLVAGALLITIGSQAMLREAQRYSPEKTLMFGVDLPAGRYSTAAERVAFFDRATENVRALPGVKYADATQVLPYSTPGHWWQDMDIEGMAAQPGEFRTVHRVTAGPELLSDLQVPLLYGRMLANSDGPEAMAVAVVSRNFADRYFGGKEALGHRVKLGKAADETRWVTIVGVVDNVLLDWTDRVAPPTIYLSYRQFSVMNTFFVVRADGDPQALAPAVRAAFAKVDPLLPLNRVETYKTFLHEMMMGLSYTVVLLMINAGIALLLSSIGIFGVMSSVVAERTHEIGVRMALGADRRKIQLSLLLRAGKLVGIGLALGLPSAAALARLLSGLVFGISPNDVGVFASTAAAVIGVSILATLIPAQRAAGVDPMNALRSE